MHNNLYKLNIIYIVWLGPSFLISHRAPKKSGTGLTWTFLVIDPFWFAQDGTANDIPTDFAVEGYPTIYFYSTTGELYSYNGGRTAEDIISFIKKNKGPRAGAVDEQTGAASAAEEAITPLSSSELLKDELWSRCHM